MRGELDESIADLRKALQLRRQHLRGVLDALGPRHLGDVDQALDARLELDEGARITSYNVCYTKLLRHLYQRS